MPQVTINEIDQSRYVVNSQRAPLIALVPVVSTFGDTESARLIQNESDYNTYYGTELAKPINGDLTRKYAINLLNSGVSLLVKRIKPSAEFEVGKAANLNSLYSSMSVGVIKNTPEQETGTTVQAYQAPDGTYFVPTGTTEDPAFDHYSSEIVKLVPRYVIGTSTDSNAKKVVPNNTTINQYVEATQGDEGALLVVVPTTSNKYVEAFQSDEGAKLVVTDNTNVYVTTSQGETGALEVVTNDAAEFDATTQVKIGDVETDIPSVQVGDYVKLVDTFNSETQVKISTVEAATDLTNVQVGDYVKLAEVEDPIDTTTEVKLSDVIADLPEATAGEYVKIEAVDTFDADTQVKIGDVIADIADVQVDDYVVFINAFNVEDVVTGIANGTYTETTITIPNESEEPEEETDVTYKMRLSATAKYFGSFGNNIGIRISRHTTNSSDVLHRDAKDTVTIATYKITKRSNIDENEETGGVDTTTSTLGDEFIKTAKLVDSLTFRLDDFSLDNSINKLPQYINQFSLLSDLSITNEDGSAVTDSEYSDFFNAVTDMLDGRIFVLTGGKDYFEKITTTDAETGEETVVVSPTTLPLAQFYNSLANTDDTTISDINTINEFWEDFKDPYIYDFDFVCAGGFTNIYSKDGDTIDVSSELTSLHANMIKLAYTRGDAVACLDTPKEYTHSDVIDYFAKLSNSDVVYSYATAHGPWCKIRDLVTGNNIEMPASLIFLATIGKNLTKNSEAQIWYAPAGVSRASTNMVVEPKYEIGSTVLNEWQNNSEGLGVRVNPIMKILSYGYTIYGNSTLMQDEDGYTKSALQSLGTRVLCNVVKKAIFSICVALTFEPNDYILWAEFKTRLSKTLEQMKINGGIGDYQIVMDDTTVTDEAKNDLTVPGKVFISPTRPAEYFDIDFTITQSGVMFDESVSSVIS